MEVKRLFLRINKIQRDRKIEPTKKFETSNFIFSFSHIFLSFLILVEMEIDFAFRYGLFGYGFGSQVEQKQLDQKYILSQSIFPRVPVPGFRKDSDFVCEPIHVDYPEFINLEERSYIGSDPVRRQANRFTMDQMKDGGHILNIKENPLTAHSYESLGPDRSQDTNASSIVDDDNQYIVSHSKQAKFLMDVMNRRKRLPGIIRKYACKRTRYRENVVENCFEFCNFLHFVDFFQHFCLRKIEILRNCYREKR